MPRPRRNPIQEERRKVLGDWAAFCLTCGHALRWFREYEADVPAACPHCGGELRRRCPACAAPVASAFAVDCEQCGAPLRPNELLGGRIRRPGRP